MGRSKDIASGSKFVDATGDGMTGNLGVGGAANGSYAITSHSSGGQNLRFENDNEYAFFRLDDNGDLKIWAHGDDNLVFMNGTGSGTTRMNIDGSGRVTTPYNPYFWAQAANAGAGNYSSGATIFTGGLVNSGTISDIGGHFNTSNGRFTAPVSGVYHFSAVVRIDSFAGNYSYLTLWDSGSVAFCRDLTSQTGTYNTQTVAASRYLSANDYVYCYLVTTGDTSTTISSDSYFSGHLVG